MGDISELELCCQQLATNKVSERKKQIEILQELLGSSHLTQQLDMNSSSSAESRVFTWDCVFRSVAGLVVKEAELMEQAENKGGKLPTSTSLNLRERKKRDCMRLLKSVIRLANKRALHLSTSALMWHIVDMLENDFTHQIFGTDYGSVLMKEVLPNRKLCCDVTSKIWNRLLHVYVLELQECEDGKRRVDRVSVTSLLYTIIGKATEHCSVHQEIIPGLSHPLKNLRQEQNQVVVEHLVCTANILCRALAADCRHMICKMGEAVFNNMLHYFTVQTTPFLKGELVEFFHIQMAAHHPCGTKSGEPGAHAHNADTWGSHLRRLYESLDNELYKYTQPSSDIGKLDERLVHLCAGVWRHVLTAFPSTIDVTQCEPSSTLMASGRHKKRRRVETGWDSMRERLASLGASERAVPWLRLLHAILARHPADLPAAELPPLLDALQQALTACKGPSVSSWLFQCLAAVAGAQVSLRLQLSAKQEATLALAWRQVWFVTLRSVAAIHRGEGLDLLSTLMRHALVTPDHKLFQVFLATSYPVTRASLDTLATFIARHHIPERYVCDNMAAATSPEQLAGVRHPLRAQLVAWLLPGGDADEPAGRADDAATRELLADALVALCLREPAAARRPHADPAPTPGDLDELQEVYLRTTFTRIRRVSDDAGGGARACSDGVVVGEVKKKLERSLRKSAMLLIEAPTQGYQQAESMLSLCCVNVMVVRGLLMNGALQAGDLSQLELLNYGKELMRIAGCALMSTDRAASLQQSQQLQLLSILRQMYACSESGGDCAGSVAQLCRSLMPAELLQWLLKQATKIVKQGRAAGAPVATATGRKRSDFDELMELEFNDQAAAGPSQDLSFFFDEDDSMSQSSVMSAVQCSPLSQEGLSEQVMLELDCVRLLARYCACDGGGGGPSSLLLPCDRAVSCQLLRLVMESDVKQRAGLQMLVAVGTGLGSDDHRLSDEDLLSLLRCVSAALRHHARDQVVVITLLDLLTTLLRHAYRDDNDVAFDECRRVGGSALAAFEWRDDAGLPAASKMAAAACLLSLAGSVGDLGSARLAGPGGEAGDECPLLLATCLELLRNDSHKVKMLTADAVKMFFGVDDRTGHYRLTAAEQEQLFVKLCEHLRESLDDVGDYKGVEKRDQLASRVYALVTSLANVATSSPYCEKKAVLALCQVVTDYGVNLDDVREVLRDVAAALGYPSLKRYMQTHLGFLISAWLDEGEKLDSLPYALFECGTLEEFYRQNYQQLVPHLVIHDSFDAVRTLALHVCGGGAVDPALTLLVECFPAVFVHVLPLFAAGGAGGLDDGDPDAEVKVKRAIVAYHKFEEAVTKPVMNQLLTNRLDEVVVCLLMLLDPGSPASSMPHALNPPAFNAYTIKTTLDYLTTYCKAGKTQSCLVMLLTTQQDNIQKVLLALSVAMARAYTLLERRRVLLMYRLFVRLLVRYLSSGLGGAWAFTLRDVVHTVCRHIGDLRLQAEESGGGRGVEASLKQEMFAIHCEILEYVFAEALKCCPEVVTHVAVVTATLVPVVKLSSGSASEKARSLLEMLFVQNASKLADVMASLHPFPDTPDFARLRAVHRKYKYADGVLSLREEIEIFLKASEASAPHSRGEGLQHIGEQLSSRRLELEVLVRECKRNGQQSILVRLICELIAVCRAAGGEEERQAAARCLGSIGVADLFTLVLQARGALQGGRYEPRLLPGSTDSCDHLFYRNATIFHQLSTYLTDSSVEVVTAASSVLKHLLATKSGQDFAALYKDATNDHLFQNLHPFRKRTRVASARIIVPHEATFLATMDIQEVWAPTNSTHADWITNLVCYLIKSTAVTDEMLLLLEPICKAKVEFCELVLPYLVHSILARRCDVHRDVLSRQVRVFFSSHCGAAAPAGGSRPTTPAFTGAASDVPLTMNKHSVRVMLNLLQYLRLQQTHTTCGLAATAWDTNFWLDVDYLQLARAAQYCSAYFTSVLFTEIACYIAADMCASELPLPPPKRAGKATMTQQEVSEISQTFFVSRLDSVGAHAAGAHAVLLEAYRAIGDSDCVYGCVVGRLADPATRITTYEMENKWERALGTYDLLTHQQPAEGSTGIVKALQRAGLDHVLHSYLEQLRAENRMEDDAGLQSVFYGSAWRDLGQWNLDTTHRSQSAEFQQTIYSALQQVADGNEASAAMSLAAGREAVIGQLLHAGLETTRNIYPALSSLQCLNELEQALPVICRAELVGDLLQRWQHSDVYSVADYDFVEPVLSLRCAVLSVLARRRGAANVDLQGALMTSLERLSRLAREAGLLQIAEKNIFRIKQLEQKWQTGELSWNLEEAKIYWARAECDTALCLLKSLVCDLKKATANGSVRRNASLYPKALCLYGDWLASTHSKHPQVIMEDYLEKAVECVERGGAQAAAVALDAYLSLARYADNQYRHVVDYMCSSTYDAKQALLRESREAASMIKTMDRNQNVSSRVLITLEKQSILDQREMSDMLRQKNTFLVKAVNNYLRLLRAGDDHDLRVFRLVSLWFHNANNDDVNALIKDGVGCIKSHKFLALMYQLAARMSTKQQHSSLFQPTLDELIVRTVKDHPHHTLPIILALANSYKDTELFASKTTPGRGRRSKVKENSVVEEDRVLAAKNMLNLLRVRGHGDIIANMEALSDAYISLAYLDASAHKKETQSINIPASQHLLALANLHNVAVPTLELPVDPTCEYKNIVHVVRFAPTFKLAGGLNLPKIITCLSSDGKQRRQLVKARDDLRQDAVMQQVFAIVNRLLQGQQETRKRRLHIRQYKVMPLSQRSGLLEWCEDTIPLGVYLVGDSQRGGGAHHKYRPGDWTASACRRAMLAASGSDKLAAFLDACRHFLPVFRHFFFEGFVEPAIWFERKLAYTRSVATNSIVGYILGLGDRHVQNILVDRNTAELVHIDLGIAFEQGRILPTPETVPFRLTRDIVDGMGITGTEGVFRRCCEKTMEVMRSSQEAIVTILEVLLHDPLYAWNLTPLKACAVQQRKHDESAIAAATTANTDLLDVETAATAAGKAGHGSDADVNKMAERVLLRLRQKLQGVEDGVPLSIEGQVSHLIQEARDPKNLACLFPGWQPYL